MYSLNCELPLIKDQMTGLLKGQPHEVFAYSGNCRAKLAVGKLFCKRILVFPVKIPFYIVFNLALLLIKMGELCIRFFRSLSFKKEHFQQFKAVLYQVVDLSLIFILSPIIRVAEIFKLAIGTLFYPGIHYKKPTSYPIQKQAEYYEKLTFNLSKILLSYQELSIEIKASLHEIEQGIKKLGENLTDAGIKHEFFSTTYHLMLPLRFRINAGKLLKIRDGILTVAERNGISLKIRLPIIKNEINNQIDRSHS